jgi:catechol 2,3-dioxygenase-like lactoylglutathione lyase family enzyme
MRISGMNTGIATADIESSVKFYTDTLGFSIKHKLDITGCKIYVMENEYTEFDLVNGDPFKPGTSTIRVTVRNFDDSMNDAKEAGFTQIGETVDSDKIKYALFTNQDGTIVILAHHKKVNIYV